MFIVAYTLKDMKDSYTVVATLEEAQSVYKTLLQDPELYTASIAAIVQSTDF